MFASVFNPLCVSRRLSNSLPSQDDLVKLLSEAESKPLPSKPDIPILVLVKTSHPPSFVLWFLLSVVGPGAYLTGL